MPTTRLPSARPKSARTIQSTKAIGLSRPKSGHVLGQSQLGRPQSARFSLESTRSHGVSLALRSSSLVDGKPTRPSTGRARDRSRQTEDPKHEDRRTVMRVRVKALNLGFHVQFVRPVYACLARTQLTEELTHSLTCGALEF